MSFPPFYTGPWAPAVAESTQQAYRNWSLGFSPFDDIGPRRSAPAENGFVEYNPRSRHWEQHGQRVRPGWKPKHYFTRPSDGKRPGFLGRLKDVAQGEGADVFITTSGDKRTLMRDRPQRHQWAGWGMDFLDLWERRNFDRDWRDQDELGILEGPWTGGVAPRGGQAYNFYSRKFEDAGRLARRPYGQVWTDARWAPGAGRRAAMPECVRDVDRDWWHNVPLLAQYFPGGRPRS